MIKIECKENLNISFESGYLIINFEDDKKTNSKATYEEMPILHSDFQKKTNINLGDKEKIKELKQQGFSRKEVGAMLELPYYTVARYWNK